MRRTSPQRRSGWIFVILSLVIIVAVAYGSLRWLGLFSPAASANTPPTTLSLAPGNDGLDCFADATWSPDGRQIAVIGTTKACPTARDPYPAVALIYDAQSGMLRQRLDLDALAHQGLPPESASAPLLPQTILWAPDGQRIAITFSPLLTQDATSPATASTDRAAGLGVLVIDPLGANGKVIYQAYPAISTGFDQHVRFDLAQATATITPNGPGGLSYPPALTYRWQSADLVIDQALSATGIPPTPPSSDAAVVSIWQAGNVNRYAQGGPGTNFATPVLTWQTRFTAWSPDGQTIIAPIQLALRVKPDNMAAPSADALAWLGAVPPGPVRDNGMGQILGHLGEGAGSANVRVPVAWSPDGTHVAAYGERLTAVTTLYDAASGRSLGSYTPIAGPKPLTGADPLLRWSPDGHRLLLMALDAGTITIWQT